MNDNNWLDQHDKLTQQLLVLAQKAGARILSVYDDDFDVLTKADKSPVTAADKLAEEVILNGLAKLLPSVPVIAEERFSQGEALSFDAKTTTFFLVDPLDGTREFIARNGEFTVNIALIVNRVPVIGVIHLPVLKQSYYAYNGRAYRVEGEHSPEPISCRVGPQSGLSVVVSRSHLDDDTRSYLQKLNIVAQTRAGSSLKLCRIAEGMADIYPRMGRTMEWDIAAGQAILQAAGGSVKTLQDEPLLYGKEGFDNPSFVARGKSS